MLFNSPRIRPGAVSLVVLLGISMHPVATCEAADGNKSGYSLFHPTPRALLRELSTDRPDKTESPYTVDAGHFQIESDLLTYTSEHDTANGADTKVDAWSVAAINLKAGLLNWMDLQLVFDSYNHVSTDDRITGKKVTQSGLGDLTTRLKINLWGNDDGKTAFAVMPFVKLQIGRAHV